jgi:hypothetical protein
VKNVGWVEVLQENEEALLVRRTSDGEESWFSKTALSQKSQVKRSGQAGFLIVSNWAAKQVGWDDYKRKKAS